MVALTAVFSGMVIALQSYTGFARYGATNAIAYIVLVSVVRELAPVLAGLMVAGRVGAAMAAELGTMRVTDQIDALSTLSTNPMKYLVAPRLLAGLLALPLLVRSWPIAWAWPAAGWWPPPSWASIPPPIWQNSVNFLETIRCGGEPGQGGGVRLSGGADGLLPRLSHSRGGAEGVGSATTSAVVSAPAS